MFTCHVCGSKEAREDFVHEVFTVGERRVLVEHIPAQVGGRCGEPTFSHTTTEKVRSLVHGQGTASVLERWVLALRCMFR